MRNHIKVVLLLLVFICLPIRVSALVEPTERFYINDYANILSSDTENYIYQKSQALNNVDGTQIVVVTIPTLDGVSIEEYANELFNNWGIGDNNKNNGLLLLLSLEERMFRVEVGYGLEGILPDGKTGRFQDEYMIPYLKQNKLDEGIRNGYNAFYKEIVELNNLDLNYNNPVVSSDSSSSGGVPVYYLLYGIIPGIIVAMFLSINPVFLVIGWFILIFGGIFLIPTIGENFYSTALFVYFSFVFAYIIVYSIRNGSGGTGRGYSSGYVFSSHFHSSHSSHGGGGHSGGGGSSRHF